MTVQLAKTCFFIFISFPSRTAVRGTQEEEEACEEGGKKAASPKGLPEFDTTPIPRLMAMVS